MITERRRTARKCLVTSKAILRTQCKREFNIRQQWSQRRSRW
jgi:hypothetical protein